MFSWLFGKFWRNWGGDVVSNALSRDEDEKGFERKTSETQKAENKFSTDFFFLPHRLDPTPQNFARDACLALRALSPPEEACSLGSHLQPIGLQLADPGSPPRAHGS